MKQFARHGYCSFSVIFPISVAKTRQDLTIPHGVGVTRIIDFCVFAFFAISPLAMVDHAYGCHDAMAVLRMSWTRCSFSDVAMGRVSPATVSSQRWTVSPCSRECLVYDFPRSVSVHISRGFRSIMAQRHYCTCCN